MILTMQTREKRLEYRKKYYEKNRYELCKNTINDFSHKRIAFFYRNYKEEIDEYLLKYPYDEYGDKIIKYYLYRMEIYKSKAVYDDCYDAGMTAYLYSVYICAATAKDYVVPYIKKVVNIYIKCALVVANETKNICKENNFIPVYLDKDNGRTF